MSRKGRTALSFKTSSTKSPSTTQHLNSLKAFPSPTPWTFARTKNISQRTLPKYKQALHRSRFLQGTGTDLCSLPAPGGDRKVPDVVMTPAGGAGLTAPITNVLDLLFCSVFFILYCLMCVCVCIVFVPILYTVQFDVMLSCLILSSYYY